jgi:xanthine dehydrogenase accessory factor
MILSVNPLCLCGFPAPGSCLGYNPIVNHPLHTQADPWAFALEELRAGRRPVLVFVVGHTGSVPGVTGTRVVVSEGVFAGTVGGGAAEKRLLERALQHGGPPALARFRHTPEADGTLCAGEQLFAVISLTRKDEGEISSIVESLGRQQTGTLSLSPEGLRFVAGVAKPHRFADDGTSWSYEGPVGLLDTLTVVGGGHVALALSRVMATLPFRIAVLDNRPDLPTMAANSFAHERRVVDYERIADEVPAGERSWVTIMTFGHEHDRRVLEGLLGRRYAYLGLMGSRAKVARMLADFRRAGVAERHLAAVRAPIGLAIGSHTPEEIAVSIAAEIIALRNRVEAPCPSSSSA